MKRHEARVKRSRRRTEDQFGARNMPAEDRAAEFEPRARRSKRSARRRDESDARTQFGARNGDSRANQFGPRNDPPDARLRFDPAASRGRRPGRSEKARFDPREQSDARTQQFAPRDGRPTPRGGQFAPGERSGAGAGGFDPRRQSDARTRRVAPGEQSDARMRFAPGEQTDARTRQFAPRDGRAPRGGQFAPGERSGAGAGGFDPRQQSDARTRRVAPGEQSDARMRFAPGEQGRPDARGRQFGGREGQGVPRGRRDAREPDARTGEFDLRTGGRAEAGRDRSREFPGRGGKPRRPERAPADLRAEALAPRGRGQTRQPGGPQARRRPTPPRPGPKAKPRGGRRPTDRMSIGAIVLSTAVGLSLLGIAERALLEGGPIGGASDPAGSEQALKPGEPGGDPGQRQQPQQPRQPGQGGAPAEQSAPNLGVLSAQVRRLTMDERGAAARQAYGAAPGGRPIVDATRTSPDKSWVFGTTAIPVPTGSSAAPEVAFYAARWTGEDWQVGLSGDKQFNTLLGAVPANVMPAAEVSALRKYGSISAAQATALVNGSRAGDGLVLPWKIGQSWSMTTTEGSARPLGSLAFSGGDGKVLAAGDGRMYRFCSDSAGRAMVMLVHPSGVATTYYRLQDVAKVREGGVVKQGVPLGRTGTDRPCGGAASPRAEVGFGLRRGGGPIPLDGAQIGGWTFQERANPLVGFAQRGALQVLPGGLMANLGRVPAADDAPSSSPSPDASSEDGAESTPAPPADATQKRSQSGANSQQ